MNEDASHKLFTAKEIEEYLGINSNTLYHWVQVRKLLEPKIKGYGRGKQHKYDMENLATLILTKVLRTYKIELFEIEWLYEMILDPNFNIKEYNPEKHLTRHIWKIYKRDREINRREGLYLTYWKYISAHSLEGFIGTIKLNDFKGTIKQLQNPAESRMLYDDNGNLKIPIQSYVLIDLISLIVFLENVTGLKL